MGKESACNVEDAGRCEFDTWVRNVLEEGMAIHSSLLAWRIPWTEEPGVHRVAKGQT